MPLRKEGTLVKGIAALCVTAATIAAGPAVASAATTTTAATCEQATTTKAFAKFGDAADYSLAPGGDFETSAGWAFTGGGKIAAGNETTGVTAGSKSLQLPIGATATSPAFCVDQSNPYFRFVAKPDNSVAGYQAIVLYRDTAGALTQEQFTSSADASWGAGNWTPSAISPLATKIPLTSANPTASVQLKFESTGNQITGVGFWGAFAGGSVGTVSVDSVEVDPYRRG